MNSHQRRKVRRARIARLARRSYQFGSVAHKHLVQMSASQRALFDGWYVGRAGAFRYKYDPRPATILAWSESDRKKLQELMRQCSQEGVT